MASEVLKAATGQIFYEKIIQFENEKIESHFQYLKNNRGQIPKISNITKRLTFLNEFLKKEKIGFTKFVYGEDYSPSNKDSDLYSINLKSIDKEKETQK